MDSICAGRAFYGSQSAHRPLFPIGSVDATSCSRALRAPPYPFAISSLQKISHHRNCVSPAAFESRRRSVPIPRLVVPAPPYLARPVFSFPSLHWFVPRTIEKPASHRNCTDRRGVVICGRSSARIHWSAPDRIECAPKGAGALGGDAPTSQRCWRARSVGIAEDGLGRPLRRGTLVMYMDDAFEAAIWMGAASLVLLTAMSPLIAWYLQ